MRRFVRGVYLTTLLLTSTACEPSGDQVDGGGESSATTTADLAPPTSESLTREDAAGDQTGAGHGVTGHAATPEGGQALLPIMQKLGAEMTALTYALMTDDYASVERSASAIAEHAPISARELERIHTVLGAEMPSFEAVDESVHVASVRLPEAARARAPGRVVERLGELQRGCVSCHVQFRERLLTNRGGQ